jgi:hypothetical protein
MEFRLVYNGRLLGASRSDPRSAHKHDIRKAFHSQLKTLWNRNPNLNGWPSWEMNKNRTMQERVAERFTVNGVGYVPLSWEGIGVACRLDILMLRPELPGQTLIRGGDIDNRLKTLFDALRIPQGSEQMEPAEGNNPFYVLLEDDKLINHISVTTDILLDDVDNNHVQLVITVNLWPIFHTSENMGIY